MEKSKTCPSKYYIYIFLIGNCIFFSMLYLQPTFILKPETPETIVINQTLVKNNDYLIYTPKCAIPNFDPWNEDIKPFYRRQPYVLCSKYDQLLYMFKNDTSAILRLNQKAAKHYSAQPIKCCSIDVIRNIEAKVPDDDIEFTPCTDFDGDLDISGKTVTVKCRTNNVIYSNTYAPVTITEEVRRKIAIRSDPINTRNASKPLSVLFVGIDSISRLNFIRTMPKTRGFLLDPAWVEYKGYNKIGENTFPNLMAILTGKQNDKVYKECDPLVVGGLDQCPFVWKAYKDLGYATAYAEDESTINTFNYNKKGFREPPMDYYFRPYSVAAGKLITKRVDQMEYCTGPESSGERVLNVALDFARTFKDHPHFGFFWMNSFSHNELNSPTRMDAKVRQFFEDLYKTGYFDNAVIIFLSDHGLRFGDVRRTSSGWLEERLPFLYFWFPKWFREKYPEKYSTLVSNGNNQLTTPYDLYITLQEILVLSGFDYQIKTSEACSSCKSLFQTIPSRSCEEAGIDKHWCTCYGYRSIHTDDVLVKRAGGFLLNQLNDQILKLGRESEKCAKYTLSTVIRAATSIETPNVNEVYLIIVIKTVPEAIFESTIAVVNGSLATQFYISRLDSYAGHSFCVQKVELKRYCYCK